MLEEAQNNTAEELDMLREVASVAYAAASDTVSPSTLLVIKLYLPNVPPQTVSSLMTFFLAMALHPTVQHKAQAEIDELLLNQDTALPTFEHKSLLPYIDAISREVLRWRPVVPMGVPHAAIVDDIYEGYFIPKGIPIIPNIWAMTRDESVFGPNPDSFNPERFLKDGSLVDANHTSLAFGFGPRACPGRFFAEDTMWLTMASVLALFDIGKPTITNPDGVQVPADLDPEYTDGSLMRVPHPLPFNCSITPRSAAAEELLEKLQSQD
ncbi:Cytochrome P450 [Mycena chlorophos]|uniref:Cytochrome P450 n=1 Tax=Mycena chlorophos TaxID=658473 RepID=A0A8H6WJI0_MYCCL|nr:Cytochrome P450 [Mycena chlorophos]